MMGGTQKQFFLTRAASSTCRAPKTKFLSVPNQIEQYEKGANIPIP
jgi:hypothetical protein